jgi:hypothetical protein
MIVGGRSSVAVRPWGEEREPPRTIAFGQPACDDRPPTTIPYQRYVIRTNAVRAVYGR